MVLRALAETGNSDIVYLIGGTGREEPNLRRMAEDLQLGGRVQLIGFVPDDALPDVYNLCDVFVMPNRVTEGTALEGDIEGFGITLPSDILKRCDSTGPPSPVFRQHPGGVTLRGSIDVYRTRWGIDRYHLGPPSWRVPWQDHARDPRPCCGGRACRGSGARRGLRKWSFGNQLGLR